MWLSCIYSSKAPWRTLAYQEVLLRIDPLGRLGCFESIAEFFVYNASISLVSGPILGITSWYVKVLHEISFCKNACWFHQRFKRKPRDGISCACSKKLCRLVHDYCLMYSIFRRGIFLAFFVIIEEKKNFLIKLFSEMDVKIELQTHRKCLPCDLVCLFPRHYNFENFLASTGLVLERFRFKWYYLIQWKPLNVITG